MYSKTLLKLIDYAIFPAVLVVSSKIIAIAFLTKYFNVAYSVEGFRLVFENASDFVSINTYSSLFMFIAIIAGLVWVLIKAHIFHDTHITPFLSARLLEMNMHDLVEATEIIFSQAFVWLSYAWVTTIIFGVQAYFGLSYWILFWASLALTILVSALMVIDLEREILTDKKKVMPKSPKGERVIKFEEIREEILV